MIPGPVSTRETQFFRGEIASLPMIYVPFVYYLICCQQGEMVGLKERRK